MSRIVIHEEVYITDQTTTWLTENGLSSITQKCLKNEMTFDVLMEADLHDIKTMCDEAGIKTQCRLKLQCALKNMPNSSISQIKSKSMLVIQHNNFHDDEKIGQQWGKSPKSRPGKIDHKFKVAIIGDSGAGKSSIVLRFAENVFTPSFIATIGVDFKIKTVGVDDKTIQLQVWDTAGQERFFQTILTSCYRGAHAIIMVYDMTQRETFDNLSKWIENIDSWASDDVIVFLVGTKVDLEHRRVVTFDEANSFAKLKGYKYCEVSAKSGHNVRGLFNSVALYCLIQYPLPNPNGSKSFQLISYNDYGQERIRENKCCLN